MVRFANKTRRILLGVLSGNPRISGHPSYGSGQGRRGLHHGSFSCGQPTSRVAADHWHAGVRRSLGTVKTRNGRILGGTMLERAVRFIRGILGSKKREPTGV